MEISLDKLEMILCRDTSVIAEEDVQKLLDVIREDVAIQEKHVDDTAHHIVVNLSHRTSRSICVYDMRMLATWLEKGGRWPSLPAHVDQAVEYD
jgi:hypothetical protein